MEARKSMKKEAELQKHKINEAFYKMKLKGKLDPHMLSDLGINVDKPIEKSPERTVSGGGFKGRPFSGVNSKKKMYSSIEDGTSRNPSNATITSYKQKGRTSRPILKNRAQSRQDLPSKHKQYDAIQAKNIIDEMKK